MNSKMNSDSWKSREKATTLKIALHFHPESDGLNQK